MSQAKMPRKLEHPANWIVITAVLLLVVYLFFPIVLILPLEIGIKNGVLPESTRAVMEPAFAPLAWLYNHCAPYHALIDAEGGFFQRQGVIDEY